MYYKTNWMYNLTMRGLPTGTNVFLTFPISGNTAPLHPHSRETQLCSNSTETYVCFSTKTNICFLQHVDLFLKLQNTMCLFCRYHLRTCFSRTHNIKKWSSCDNVWCGGLWDAFSLEGAEVEVVELPLEFLLMVLSVMTMLMFLRLTLVMFVLIVMLMMTLVMIA